MINKCLNYGHLKTGFFLPAEHSLKKVHPCLPHNSPYIKISNQSTASKKNDSAANLCGKGQGQKTLFPASFCVVKMQTSWYKSDHLCSEKG